MSLADRTGPIAYQVFGMTLLSDIAFPELRPAVADAAGAWRFVVTDATEPRLALARCGEERLPGDVAVRLGVEGTRHRIAYDDTGTFDVDAEQRRITWYARPHVREDAVRIDVLSRVLAVALHAQGHFCLHASAVQVDGRAIGFLAPKGTGKSTLAVALARAGAPLIADDALAVRAGAPAHVLPGVRSVRLWNDSLRRLSLVAGGDAVATGAIEQQVQKHLLCALDERLLADAPAPLDALYLLRPAPPTAASAARVRVAPMHAAVLLAAQAKLGALAGGAIAGTVLSHAAAVAREVPVYALSIARDLARLDEAAHSIITWHGGVLAESAR